MQEGRPALDVRIDNHGREYSFYRTPSRAFTVSLRGSRGREFDTEKTRDEIESRVE
jgi:hypothetical protein